MKPPSDPGDWEAQALLPARLLAGTDPETREKLQKAGKYLYLLILEHLGPEPAGPTLAYEFQTLIGELQILHHSLQAVMGMEPIAEELGSVLRETLAHLEPLETQVWGPKDSGIRPFALSLSQDPQYQESMQALGEGMGTLRHEPSREQWLTALLLDLRWVMTVLQQHIARRTEMSSIRPEDCYLCSTAGLLARSLERTAEMLQEALREAQEGEA